MDKDATPHSIWLIPSGPMAQQLRGTVRDLAAQYDAPAFEPHMTLLGDLKGPPACTHDACERIIREVGTIGATVKGIATSPAYFMSLFLDLNLGTNVDACRHSLSQHLRGQGAAEFRPHLSLAYGLNEEQRTRASLADFNGDHLIFNRLAVVHSAKSVPIENWSILSEIAL